MPLQLRRDQLKCVPQYTLRAEMQVERNSRKILARLRSDGWVEAGATGSHHKLKHPVTGQLIVVPHPKKDLPLGTARQIAKTAGWL